jgi:polyisoprenoid-binding protein YceI
LKTLFAILLAIGVQGAIAQQSTWKIDPVHSNVEFTVTHMVISEVTGHFKDYSVTLTQGKDDFSGSTLTAVIKTASISTDNDMRDNHLRSSDFFDVEKFPEMTFKSTSFEKLGDSDYRITGDLTMHGVTKSVVLDTKYNGQIKDSKGTSYAGFKATGKVNRYDFGLKWNKALEAGGIMVSENVDITLNVKMVQQ